MSLLVNNAHLVENSRNFNMLTINEHLQEKLIIFQGT